MLITVQAVDLEVGDEIFEGNKPTKVTRLDKRICRHHVHVNDKDCYDNAAVVKVRLAQPKSDAEYYDQPLTQANLVLA